jgi:hypothetical protein
MDCKKLCIRLIREQIRNQLFVNALENLGFDCAIYTLNISEEILELAGFHVRPDYLYREYFDMIEKVLEEINYTNFDEKSIVYAGTIYSRLKDLY